MQILAHRFTGGCDENENDVTHIAVTRSHIEHIEPVVQF